MAQLPMPTRRILIITEKNSLALKLNSAIHMSKPLVSIRGVPTSLLAAADGVPLALLQLVEVSTTAPRSSYYKELVPVAIG